MSRIQLYLYFSLPSAKEHVNILLWVWILFIFRQASVLSTGIFLDNTSPHNHLLQCPWPPPIGAQNNLTLTANKRPVLSLSWSSKPIMLSSSLLYRAIFPLDQDPGFQGVWLWSSSGHSPPQREGSLSGQERMSRELYLLSEAGLPNRTFCNDEHASKIIFTVQYGSH